jgi:hypothetical protein
VSEEKARVVLAGRESQRRLNCQVGTHVGGHCVKVINCKVCEYGPCEVTKIPLRCFVHCEKVMASVVKCNCYGPI